MKTALAVAAILFLLGVILVVAAGFLDKRRVDDVVVILVCLLGLGLAVCGMPTALLIAALLAWMPWA